MQWLAAHPVFATLIGTAIGVSIATIVSLFSDPDNDPKTPPPKWVVPFIIMQRVFTIVAPKGTLGLFGGRISIPVLHFPRVKGATSTQTTTTVVEAGPTPDTEQATVTTTSTIEPPPKPEGLLLALVLLFSVTLPACAGWAEVARLSLTAAEQAHAEAARAARGYSLQRIADFKDRAAKVKTIAELEALELEHAKYATDMSHVIVGLNKSWAVITQLKVGYPILKRVTDPNERKKIDGYIVEALAFLLQGKDGLSKFGVEIGGAK